MRLMSVLLVYWAASMAWGTAGTKAAMMVETTAALSDEWMVDWLVVTSAGAMAEMTVERMAAMKVAATAAKTAAKMAAMSAALRVASSGKQMVGWTVVSMVDHWVDLSAGEWVPWQERKN